MCKGLGLDLCGIARMAALVEDERFLGRYFTSEEAAYVRGKGAGAAQTLAGLYAAKEAVLKAMGTGIALPLREVEIWHAPGGQPQVRLTGQAARRLAELGGGTFLLTVSHEGDTAAAAALWQA